MHRIRVCPERADVYIKEKIKTINLAEECKPMTYVPPLFLFGG